MQPILDQSTHLQSLRTLTQQRLHHFQVSAQQSGLDLAVHGVLAIGCRPRSGDQLVGHAAHRRDDDHRLSRRRAVCLVMAFHHDVCHVGEALRIPYRGAAKLVYDHHPLRATKLNLCQRLTQVGDHIIGVLNAQRVAHQVIFDARFGALLTVQGE